MLNSNYQIKEGLTENQIDQLIKYSNNDSEILKNTHDSVRFRDRASFNSWIEDGKQIFTLNDKDQNLLGIIWFSKKFIMIPEYKDYGITFAIRIYHPARGKGLSKDFAKQSIESLFETDFYKNSSNKGIWLATNHSNEIAKKVYGNLGFREIKNENGRIIMILG